MITGLAMLMLLMQATGGGGGGGGRPKATPVDNPGTWFTTDDYPVEALRKSEEGRVTFFVNVDASGAPTACYILTSSGSSALDNGTCAVVMKKGHFEPAHDSSGKAVASTWSNSTVWRIPGPSAIDLSGGPVQQYATTVEISLDPDGKVTGCKATSSVRGIDPCETYPVGHQANGPTVKDGKPVASVMTVTASASIRPAD
jgi:TonB family protein